MFNTRTDSSKYCRGTIITIVILLAISYCSCNSEAIREVNYPGHSDSIINKASDLIDGGEFKRSHIYLDSAYRAFNHAGAADIWKKYRYKANFYLNIAFNSHKAGLYVDSMSAIIKNKGAIYKQEYAWTFFYRADVLVAEKKYEEAFRNYYDGREFVSHYIDSCDFAQFTYRLGLVRYKQKQFQKALPYLKKALAEASYCNNSPSFRESFVLKQSICNTIALCFEQMNNPDSAISFYLRDISFISRNASRFPERKKFVQIALGVVKGNIGGAYARLGKYGTAEKFLVESININDRKGYAIQDAQTAKIKLAEVYLKTSRIPEAARLIDQLKAHLALSGKNPADEFVRLKWYQLEWMYFDKTGDVVRAYMYFQKYHQNKDSIDEVNSQLNDIDMDVIFRENEHQHKLELLNKESQLKTGYLAAVIFFLLATVGFLIAVLQNRKRLKVLNAKIIVQNTDMHTALSALQQSQEENSRIMEILAHDLRNPVSATISVTNMLLEQGNLHEEDKRMLELMRTTNVHSLEMITNLLNMHTTNEELKKEPVKMHTLLHYCVNLLNFKAAEKKQVINLDAEEIILNVNREKIWRVISNLLANAIKFSPEGTDIKVGMARLATDDFVRISIADHGIGIPDHTGNKIFKMFTDAKRSGTSGEPSFGLGLAISRQIVEAHKGRISFEPNPEGGTIFHIDIPIV